MKRDLMTQLILLGVALLAMIVGIVFTRDMEAVDDPTLMEVVSASARSEEDADESGGDEIEATPAALPSQDPVETSY